MSGMITDDTIKEIEAASDILEVVEDFISMKKKGQYWWGLCPFHEDSDASFTVTPSRGIYKCFACNASGDTIKFLRDKEGYTYVEALKYLAQKYGIEIHEKEATPEQEAKKEKKESILVALSQAKDFYIEQMTETPSGKSLGLGYFRERGFRQNIIEKFELGYSPDSWNLFEQYALSKGFKQDILEDAGLLTVKDDKRYDRFRGRVMFPIKDLSGRVIAFGARALQKDAKPKYLNSPETEVYHKSDALYGIFHGKQAIRQEDNCYLVEGYTDVISLHQVGIENVVASSGTALTEGQIKLISRFTQNVTVLYDGDAAGIKASLRGTDMLLEQGMDVRVVPLPDGQDPDSFSQELGGTRFKEYLDEHAQDFILFKTDLYLKEAQNDPIKKANVAREIVHSIIKIKDPIKREVFFKECSRLLDISEDSLLKVASEIQQRLIEQEEKRRTKDRRTWEQTPPPPPDFHDVPDYALIPEDLAEEDVIIPPIDELKQPEDRPTGKKTTKKTSPFQLDSIGLQEYEFIRILLLYGFEEIDDDGNMLYQFLFEEIEGIEFLTPACQQIILDFKNSAAIGKKPSVKYFKEHHDQGVKDIMEMMTKEEYHLSEEWDKRHGIYIPRKDESLAKGVYLNILKLKFRRLEKMVEESTQKIGELESDEEIMEQMSLIIELNNQRKELAKQLGIVIG